MKARLPSTILNRIRNCHERFGVRITGPLVVGLSGGKDSLTLALSLQELGFRVKPVIVDMGYPGFDSNKIAESARILGLDTTITRAAEAPALVQLSLGDRRRVIDNLAALSDSKLDTPCGACSNTKRLLLLAEARRLRAATIILGHHRDDFIATLLKDYFAYAYHRVLGEYDRCNFRAFVSETSIDLTLLNELVIQGMASTMAFRFQLERDVEVIRSLALVPERLIEETVQYLDLPVAGSGCSHAVFENGNQDMQTKREIVHSEWRRRDQNDPNLAEELMTLALSTLQPDGSPSKSNPRGARARLLPGFDRRTV